MIFAFMVISYILIFFCGRFWQWETDKGREEERRALRLRYYDKEGRVRDGTV